MNLILLIILCAIGLYISLGVTLTIRAYRKSKRIDDFDI